MILLLFAFEKSLIFLFKHGVKVLMPFWKIRVKNAYQSDRFCLYEIEWNFGAKYLEYAFRNELTRIYPSFSWSQENDEDCMKSLKDLGFSFKWISEINYH